MEVTQQMENNQQISTSASFQIQILIQLANTSLHQESELEDQSEDSNFLHASPLKTEED